MSVATHVIYEFGPFRIDPDRESVLRESQPLAMPPKVFALLLTLVRRNQETISKDELLQAVWPGRVVEEANLSQCIFVLRKLVGDAHGQRRYIVTQPGKGYRLAADVRTVVTGDPGDAADTIVALAAKRHIVMVNEAHHDTHTRLLTLALLPRLRALGYTYFAAEALGRNDPDLAKRGYPTRQSGTEYLRDPVYGDIVSEAIRLSYTLVPYDNALSGQARDTAQAEALYRRVFAKNPYAKLFVHAGYAHIDKATDRLGNVRPGTYDMDVILPPSLNIEAFGRGKYGYRINTVHGGLSQVAGPGYMERPRWLAFGGTRHPYPISAALCQGAIPCVVDALYANEPDDAIAADRYAFLDANEIATLYLRPGQYRLRVDAADRHTLSERPITVR